MAVRVRATYSSGVLTPMVPLDLDEGSEVVVSIEVSTSQDSVPESMLQMFERLRNSVPSETWDDLPSDLVKHKKHCLYGAQGGRVTVSGGGRMGAANSPGHFGGT